MPSGPEDEDQDQDPEHDRAGPVGAGREPGEALVEGLDEADHERAEDGAGEVADPAEHGGGERDQPELEARVVAHVELEQVDDPGGACEGAGERERDGDRPVHVDPHHRRRLRVLRDGAHRLPLLRRADEPGEQDQDGDRDQERGELVPRVGDVADPDRLRARDERRHRVEVDAVERERDVLDDERHADRGDQRREPRRAAQPPVGDELDPGVHDREHDHDHDERQEHAADRPRQPTRPSRSPSTLTITDHATSPESAKTSPCAKLISCRIP